MARLSAGRYLRLMRGTIRSTLLLLTLLGLMLPRVSAVLVHFVPGVQVVQICSGNRIETIVLDADGAPIEQVSQSDLSCALEDPARLKQAPARAWLRLAQDFGGKPQPRPLLRPLPDLALGGLGPRAPPMREAEHILI